MTAAFSIGFGFWLGPPSANLLLALAAAGVGLLIAYSVAIGTAEERLGRSGSREAHEAWLGFAAGCGFCALVGIGVALALAAHREAGYANLLDEIGFWWSVSSIGMLGVIVASLPIFSYEWRKSS